jgi:hypothetical protein
LENNECLLAQSGIQKGLVGESWCSRCVTNLLSRGCHAGIQLGGLASWIIPVGSYTESSHNRSSGFSQSKRCKGEPPRWKPISEVTYFQKWQPHCFCILFTLRKPINLGHSQGKRYVRHEYQKSGVTEAFLKMPTVQTPKGPPTWRTQVFTTKKHLNFLFILWFGFFSLVDIFTKQ